MPIISIIIPIYNVGKYLRECLDSIINQTYADYECLLIDDGSLDDSGAICDEYAIKDTRFRVFHKDNGGVCSARNLALKEARGEWVTFIDGDDFIGKNYIENMYKATMNCSGVDFVQCGLQNYKDGKVSMNQKYEDIESSYSGLLFNRVRGLIVSKLFKLSIIKEQNLQFDDKMKIGEDFVFTMDYILYVNRFTLCSSVDYFYRRHSASATNYVRTIKDYEVSLYEFKREYDSVLTYINSKQLSEDDCSYRLNLLARDIVCVMLILFRGNIDNKEIENHIHNDFTTQQRQLLNRVQGYKHKIISLLIRIKQYTAIKYLLKLK